MNRIIRLPTYTSKDGIGDVDSSFTSAPVSKLCWTITNLYAVTITQSFKNRRYQKQTSWKFHSLTFFLEALGFILYWLRFCLFVYTNQNECLTFFQIYRTVRTVDLINTYTFIFFTKHNAIFRKNFGIHVFILRWPPKQPSLASDKSLPLFFLFINYSNNFSSR